MLYIRSPGFIHPIFPRNKHFEFLELTVLVFIPPFCQQHAYNLIWLFSVRQYLLVTHWEKGRFIYISILNQQHACSIIFLSIGFQVEISSLLVSNVAVKEPEAICDPLFIYFFTHKHIFFLFVVNFVIHWNEKALGSHVFPIPIPPPTSLPTHSLQVLPEHQVQSGWLLSKSLQAINAGEGVEKREPSYTVGGNAN